MKIRSLLPALLLFAATAFAAAQTNPGAVPTTEPANSKASFQLVTSALFFDQPIEIEVSPAFGTPSMVGVWIDHETVSAKVVHSDTVNGKTRVQILITRPPELALRPNQKSTDEEAKKRAERVLTWSNWILAGKDLPVTIWLSDGDKAAAFWNPLVTVRLLSYGEAAVVVLVLLVAFCLAIYGVLKTRMLFDPTPVEYPAPAPAPAGAQGWRWQFSLSRVQGFVWMLVVFFSVVVIYATTGSTQNVLNATALGLLAIGGGTSFVALMLDQPTPQTAASSTTPPARNLPPANTKVERPAWRLLLTDILDASGEGNMHRLQIVIWTFSLVVVYLHRLFGNFMLPQFDGETFALMGVSSATYLSFKAKEK